MAHKLISEKALREARRVLRVVASIIAYLLGEAVALLAAGAMGTPADDEASCPTEGGVLNYRTGKLDDGLDPYGWYERY